MKKKFKVHYLVAKTFIPQFNNNEHVIIHKDEDTENNSLDNLEVAQKEYIVEEEVRCEFRKLKLPKHPSFEEYYEVCNCGQHIRSLRTGKFLKQWMTRMGYMEVRMIDYKTELEKCVAVHQAVAYTFIGNSDPKKIPDHGNGIRHDNRVENLSFKTYSENNTGVEKLSRLKPIVQLSLDGDFVKEYDSVSHIENTTEYSKAMIYMCLRADDFMSVQAYGFRWKYKFDTDKPSVYTPIEGEVFKEIGKFRYYNKLKKEFQEFDFDYKVSNFGTLLNNKGLSIGFHIEGGYPSVQMKDNLTNNMKSFQKQRLVAEYFVLKPDNYDPVTFEVKFIDKDPKNVRFDNLQWITHKEHHSEIRGRKIRATGKDGKTYDFESIGDATKFLEDLMEKKGHYLRSIKSCLNGYQETAYGFKWVEL